MTKKAIKRMIFFIFCPFRYYRLSEDKINPSALRRAPGTSSLAKARGSPSESPPQHSGHGSLLLPKAKGMDEEVRGRLSGHGFSTERREERRRMRSEFPRWGNKRADESIPEPRCAVRRCPRPRGR